MRVRILTVALLLAGAGTASAQQAPPAGDAVFARACASCHQPGQTAVPPPDALRAYTPEAIVNALTNGKMAAQGATLTTAERVAIAQFLTGRTLAASSGRANQCTAATPTTDPLQGPRWMAWGNDTTNARYAAQGGLTAQDLPRLKLKWAFAYRGRDVGTRPAGAGGRQALRRERQRANCTRSTRRPAAPTGPTSAEFGVRSALTVWPYRSGGATRYAVFFGDQHANAYAVDAVTGQLVWKRKADDHQYAAITGAIAVADGRRSCPCRGSAKKGPADAGRTRAARSAAT